MGKRRRAAGGLIAIVGYVLSPASWWNDAFVNIPIAYIVASLASILSERLFKPAFIGAYLATNIIGILMMYYGGYMVAKGERMSAKRMVLVSVIVSLAYTAAVLALIELGVLRPLF